VKTGEEAGRPEVGWNRLPLRQYATISDYVL
jgi:hypothetical protein